ncbi:hypothetical protein BLNAU_8079 [Blattamonas nauphoetae]|uniref:Uncharacterized protein n=1 Tax=Blattamonas nauphoetae TaxID=2049346 RepID=A0ABQ9XZW5_9EUKA|nr:hypothetical protein BLNAU_8079 [Blattamonas nauphoetae]
MLGVALRRFRRQHRTCPQLSPHSSPNPSSAAPEGRTRLLLADLRESRTSEHCGVQTDRQNIDTADLATCHAVPAVAGILGDTHHIVSFAHCMDGWVLSGDWKDRCRHWSPCRVNSSRISEAAAGNQSAGGGEAVDIVSR